MPDVKAAALYVRPEFENPAVETAVVGDIERRPCRFGNGSRTWIRSASSPCSLSLLSRGSSTPSIGDVNELMFPTFTATFGALIKALINEGLLDQRLELAQLLLTGYVIGIGIASVLVVLGVWTRFRRGSADDAHGDAEPPAGHRLAAAGDDLVRVSATTAIVFHAAALDHLAGGVEHAFGLSGCQRDHAHGGAATTASSGIPYICKILIPAAFPSILTGLRIGWAFAWRTLIAAELVFGGQVMDTAGMLGAEGGSAGGLGWIIFAESDGKSDALRLRGPVHGHHRRHPDRERYFPEHRGPHGGGNGACSRPKKQRMNHER